MDNQATSFGKKLARSPKEKLILPEQEFLQRVTMECRRSERSLQRFILVLITGFQQLPAETQSSVTAKVLAATRETDAVGWYETDSVLGILCGELGLAELPRAEVAILNKIRLLLATSEEGGLVATLYILPRNPNKPIGGSDTPTRLLEYLDPLSSPKMRVRVAIKRTIDIVSSLLLLTLFAIPMVVVAIILSLDSPGPILFRQTRVGRRGNLFTCLKFRSMVEENNPAVHEEYVAAFIRGTAVQNADESGRKVFKLTNDSRITRFGWFLRRSSLDELPQLWNVLHGEMSLVGPRPPIPYEVDHYELWHQRRILEVKPGITGLWQVCGRSRLGFDEMVRLDLRYARTWSPWLDLKIIFLTPFAMLGGTGAN